MIKTEERIGEVNRATNGQMMKIIAYRKCSDIDVQFEDGTIVEHKTYQSFSRGNISNPNFKDDRHLNEVKYTKYRMNMRIVKYRSYDDIDVLFDDGYLAEHVSYDQFNKNSILNKNIATNASQARHVDNRLDKVGEKAKSRNGQMMTIIKYTNIGNIDVQFEDGTIVTNKQYCHFIDGRIANPNYLKYIGMTAVANNGQQMKVIGGTNSKDLTIQFEDGTIVTGQTMGSFKKGFIKNPNRDTFTVKLEEKCKEAGVDPEKVREYIESRKPTFVSVNKAIEIVLGKNTKPVNELKELCEKYNVNYDRARYYKYDHKNISDEDVIKNVTELDNKVSFSKMCVKAGVKPGTAVSYRARHPELSDEEVINEILNRQNKETLTSKLKRYGITQNRFHKAKRNYMPDATDDEVIKFILEREYKRNITKRLEDKGITRDQYQWAKKKLPDATEEEIIEFILSQPKRGDKELKELCEKYNVNYGYAQIYKKNHGCSSQEAVDYYVNRKPRAKNRPFDKELKELCDKHGVNFECAKTYKRNHSCSNEEVIEYYLTEKEETLTELCRKHKISRGSVANYKKEHPELKTNQEIIQSYMNYMDDKFNKKLKDYCEKFSVDYKAAYKYKYKMQQKGIDITDEDAVIHLEPRCCKTITGDLIFIDV